MFEFDQKVFYELNDKCVALLKSRKYDHVDDVFIDLMKTEGVVMNNKKAIRMISLSLLCC